DSTAYTYLPQSTATFVDPEELKRSMERAGLQGVIYRTMMFGTVAIHIGINSARH
ncbi:MAG: class I SAM-dependent methyltransferase, partial [Caldilineaceae bacterium]